MAPITKRRTKARKRTKKRKPRLEMPIGGFPKTATIKLRYVGEFSLNPGLGVYSTQVYTANGMYDPNITGLGHQPSNFDKWIAQYDHYTIVGSKITCQYVPSTLSNVVPGVLGCLVSDNGARVSGMANLSDLLEQPGANRAHPMTVGIINGPATGKLTATFSASKFFGKPKAGVLGDHQLRGSVGANPPDQAFYEIYLYSANGNDPGECAFIVTLEYTAIMSERKPATYS